MVLVTLDGARGRDVLDPGTMPHLVDIARTRGAAIHDDDRGDIRASGPNFVSLPGYTELFTGRRPEACADNDCAPVAVPTLADQVAAHGEDAAVFASWERLERAASARHDGVYLSAGQDSAPGEASDPWPGIGRFRRDRLTAAAALAYLEHRHPTFLFLGLGEPDEYAHRGDMGGYLSSLRAADAIIADLVATLARMGTRGERTALFVTADHGRASDFRSHGRAFPESARVWLVAAGAGIGARGAVATPGTRHLADIAPTVRRLLGLPRDQAPTAGAPLSELLGDGA